MPIKQVSIPSGARASSAMGPTKEPDRLRYCPPRAQIVTRLEHVQHDDAVCDDAQPHARQRTGDESASRTGSEEDGVALSDEVDSGACDMLFFRGAD